jgi:DNA polymerase-1
LELGRQLRKAFIPKEGCVYVDGDYSQIELRVLAAMSGDETLIKAFNEGQDIHALTASQVFNVPFEEVTPQQRSNAKAVNFGIVYGIGAFSLGQDIGISRKEAERYIEGYFEKYPKVKTFMSDMVEFAKKNGYGATIFNRIRHIPEISSSNFVQRSFGERVAMNMPVQGSAADIIKIAMVKVHKRLKDEGLKSKLILQVHDELLIEAEKSELDRVKLIMSEEMESAVKLPVPLEIDVHVGETWYEAK